MKKEVLCVEWDESAVFDVSREVVCEILIKAWERDCDLYKINESIKNSFDRRQDTVIKDKSSTLAVGVVPPREIVCKDLAQNMPGINVLMVPINNDELRFLYWQRLKEITDLISGLSPYYSLRRESELQLSFPVEVYAKNVDIVQATLI